MKNSLLLCFQLLVLETKNKKKPSFYEGLKSFALVVVLGFK